MKILTLLAVVFTIVAVACAVQNPMPIVVTFFGWQAQESLAVVSIVFGAGVLTGLCGSFPSIIRRMRKIAQWSIDRVGTIFLARSKLLPQFNRDRYSRNITTLARRSQFH